MPIFMKFFKSKNLYKWLWDFIIKKDKFNDEGLTYTEILQEDGVPDLYLFDLTDIKGAIIIGREPRPEELPEILKNQIWWD